MEFKSLFFIASMLAIASANPKSYKPRGDRIAALYVKDSENGELRFLTGNSNAGVNTALNQFITQKQDILEQLRPNAGFGNNGFGNTGFGTGAGTGLGTLGTLGSFGSSSSSNGVSPIIVNLSGNGNANTGTGTTPTGNIPIGPSPIGSLLPQIIAQSVVNQRRVPTRNGNRRRVVNNRRRGQNKNKVYVVRPQG